LRQEIPQFAAFWVIKARAFHALRTGKMGTNRERWLLN